MVTDGLTVLVNPAVPSAHVTVPAQFETVKTALLPAHIAEELILGVGGLGHGLQLPSLTFH